VYSSTVASKFSSTARFISSERNAPMFYKEGELFALWVVIMREFHAGTYNNCNVSPGSHYSPLYYEIIIKYCADVKYGMMMGHFVSLLSYALWSIFTVASVYRYLGVAEDQKIYNYRCRRRNGYIAFFIN
jgi:hypothetical protein